MRARRIATRLGAMLFGTLLAVALCEAALRLVGFEYRLEPVVQFGWPDPQAISKVYEPDRDLIWVTQNYKEMLAAAARAHPDVVFMGDSCTEFGTYPRLTMAALETAHSSLNGIKVGVGGWSTEQGRIQMSRDVIPLHPKVVTVYYGWNDHWMAFGPNDHQMVLAERLRRTASHLRVAQLVLKGWVAMVDRRNRDALRVPIDRYRENLDAMIAAARRAGIRVVLITAPSGHVAGHEPAYLAERHIRHLSQLIPLHAEYVAATRDAAQRDGAVLCDAAARFAADPRHGSYFRMDGIHLTAAGDQAMARLVAGCVDRALTTTGS